MRTRHIRGNTAQLNGLNLSAGQLAVDTEKKALRFYDGETQGGFECTANLAFTPPPLPGSIDLVAGDSTAGFYGEVSSDELLTYETLASTIGLSAGTSINNTESLWLKFIVDGNVIYVAKKATRDYISWDDINAVGAVYNNDLTPEITIDGRQYKVTLLTGGNEDPSTAAGGEWNRLMYPIHIDDPEAMAWGINYTNTDLTVGGGPGRSSWCQETIGNTKLHRGHTDITYYGSAWPDYQSGKGWRPVLRPI